MDLEEKRCTGCKELKPASLEFFYAGPRGKLRPSCISCQSKYYRHIRVTQPGKQALRDRKRHLMENYGMTPAEYDEMLMAQGGVCAICEHDPPPGRWRRLQVDHCHSSGTIRGLLCLPCNTLLGHARDDIKNLVRAIDYLEKSKGWT